MIPIAILVGFVIGRWWVVLVAALLWIAVLLLGGSISGSQVLAAAGLAAANAAVGVAAHQAQRVLFRSGADAVRVVRRHKSSQS